MYLYVYVAGLSCDWFYLQIPVIKLLVNGICFSIFVFCTLSGNALGKVVYIFLAWNSISNQEFVFLLQSSNIYLDFYPPSEGHKVILS